MDIWIFAPFDQIPGLFETCLNVCRNDDERETITSAAGVDVRFEDCEFHPGFVGSYYEPEEPAGVDDFKRVVIEVAADLEIVPGRALMRKIAEVLSAELDDAAVNNHYDYLDYSRSLER